MTDQQNEKQEEKSFFGVIIHSFFIIPFLIAVFSVLLFASVRILTMEKQTVYDILNDVKTGGSTKRWQAAFELSKILANPKLIPDERRFEAELISAFEKSRNDDNRVRQYLALAMGRTGNPVYVDPLITAIEKEKEDNLYAIVYALGILKDNRALKDIYPLLEHPNARIRLGAVIAVGNIGDRGARGMLRRRLNDNEPNVQWDAAIALAKLNDNSGRDVLLKLLDRAYIERFTEVDSQEQEHMMLVTIEAAGGLNDPVLNTAIKALSENDQNLKIRRAALAVLE